MSTRAYVDLMFAWAHARLRDPDTARGLSEDATLRLSTGDRAHQAVAAAFGHRIRQAIDGNAHSGDWPSQVQEAFDRVDEDRGLGLMSLRYVTDRVRQQSRVLEPDRRPNPYAPMLRFRNEFRQRLDDLSVVPDGPSFDREFRALVASVASDEQFRERILVLATAADAGPRIPDDTAQAVLGETRHMLDRFLQSPLPADWQSEIGWLTAATCRLAVARDDRSFLVAVAVRLASWARRGDRIAGQGVASVAFKHLLTALYRLDMSEQAALLLDEVAEVEWSPEGDVGLAQLPVAGCQWWLGLRDRAGQVFETVRGSLFTTDRRGSKPEAIIRLAEDYALVLGKGPAVAFGPLLLELFTKLRRVPNTFTTATHYSRLHLGVAEAAILAATTDDFRPVAVVHARLGPDETRARRELLPPLRQAIETWAGQDW
jgi:hypothetical protein